MAWLGSVLPAVALVGLPFVLSALAAIVAHLAHHHALARYGERELPVTTGAWVAERLRALGLHQHVSVRPVLQDDGGFDAFWPARGLIALRARVFHARTAFAWAVGAHELGHALNLADAPRRERLYTAARLISLVAGQVFVAVAVTNLLYASAAATTVALVAAVVAAVAQAVVLHDEAEASRVAWRLLHADPSLGDDHRGAARTTLVGALGVYLASFVGRLGVLAGWSVLADAVARPVPTGAMTYLALWMVLASAPILLLRAAAVVHQVVRPQKVESHLQMAWAGPREAGWDLATGLLLLALLASVWNTPVIDGALPWVVLAAVPAVVPLALIGRLAVLLPLLVGARAAVAVGTRAGVLAEPTPLQRHLEADRDALFDGDEPGWLLRAVGLLRIAYVPLVAVLLVRMLHGGGF